MLRIRDRVEANVPLMAHSRSLTQHEGHVHSHEQEGGNIISEGYEEIAAPVEIKFSEVPELVGERLIRKVDALADEMARQTSQLGYSKIDELSSAAGTAVDGKGRPFSQEMFLKALESMEIDFDERGNPQMEFHAHPDMVKVMVKRGAEWERDTNFKRRYRDLMQRKREAWRARESNRKLVG